MTKGSPTPYKDIDGRTIKIGDTVEWTVNHTNLKKYDNYMAEVKEGDGWGIHTTSPFKGCHRPIDKHIAKTLRIVEQKNV